MFERSLRWFAADKVVAKSFETAADLQRHKKVKDIVTEDGTEFK